MKRLGLSLGLCLLCILHARAEQLRAVGLDTSKIAGKWHVVALASDSEGLLQKKEQLKMAMATLTVLGGDELKVSFAIPTLEGCRRSEAIYRPTAVPGEFYSSERGPKTVQVLDTDGQTYAVIFATRVKDGKTYHMLRLYSRTPEVSPEITALFKKFAREKNYTEEMMVLLPRQEECSVDEV
ncbi:extracellular fatty acid-binding protein [Colius striatus]|uniref:extracellular fatty acid-binding protein n=1 Tax=Colius striatus TaxID=57412 RepID=UPI0005296203|nr:extracellular fatty acid-binding protein [Colius striatus]XP_061867659.1 extracellular fatty acid-binding protein [Colius striatus]